LLFQAIDDKTNCVGIYADGKLHFDNLPTNLTKTWKYAGYLDGHEIEYANLYCGGHKLEEVCPEDLKDAWGAAKRRFEAYLKSFNIAKISLNEHCVYDLIPHSFLEEFFEIRNNITEHVLETLDRPKNYDFLNDLSRVVYEIRHQELKIDFSNIRKLLVSTRTRSYAQNLKKHDRYCRLNMFGTITGRFTTEPGSFPLLTMPKELRAIIQPHNEWFLALDYNGAEIRTLLSLLGEEQPDYDIHDWNVKNLFNNEIGRDEAKKKFFAWLYNPNSSEIISDLYDRDKILDSYWHEGELKTEYDREIKVDRGKALNYCLQSTCADTISERMIEIFKYLKDKKSRIAFSIHDELIIDLSDSERHLVPEINEMFSNNKLGKFLTNIRVGKNLGDMRELNL
tara:strand:- start:928 stop:2112 length:1185 start_codon:yes stop_codon:yes gene_type:complete